MVRRRSPWIGIAIALAVAAVAWFFGSWMVEEDVLRPLEAVAIGAFASISVLAASSYRSGRDPQQLLVSAGSAAVVVQFLLISNGAIGVDIDGMRAGRPGGMAIFLHGQAVGYIALLVSLALAVPWRERRGRAPLRPGSVWIPMIAWLLLANAALWWRPSWFASGDVGGEGGEGPAAFAMFLAVVGVLAAVGATRVRYLRDPWLPGAIAASALTVVAFVFRFGETRTFALLTGAGLMAVTAAGLLLAGLLRGRRSETTRMRRATDRAAEVMEGRAEIAATIAHDVRGPVGTIKGLATTTRQSYARLDDDERQEFIGMIEQESGRLLRLVDQVALALKVDAGTLDPTLRVQPIAPLIQMAIGRTEAGGRRIEVQADEAVEAPADTRWFVEAIRQGVDNALGFSPEDEPVGVDLLAEDEGAVVAISDRGPGIPADIRGSLFQKFSRWRPPGYEDRQGSGLGLFIVRGIAEVHGGDARLDDAPGGGTMLRIRLPREEIGK